VKRFHETAEYLANTHVHRKVACVTAPEGLVVKQSPSNDKGTQSVCDGLAHSISVARTRRKEMACNREGSRIPGQQSSRQVLLCLEVEEEQ
jgi:hypothetical protein